MRGVALREKGGKTRSVAQDVGENTLLRNCRTLPKASSPCRLLAVGRALTPFRMCVHIYFNYVCAASCGAMREIGRILTNAFHECAGCADKQRTWCVTPPPRRTALKGIPLSSKSIGRVDFRIELFSNRDP